MTQPATALPDTTDTGLSGVATGTRIARTDGAWQRRIWPMHACGFALLVAALVAIVAMALRSREADAGVAHTLEVRRASGVLFSIVQDAESSVRGYVLTGDPSLLRGYIPARDAVPAAEAQLGTLVQDNPAQGARLARLAPLIEQRLALLAAAIEVVRNGDHAALAERMRAREGSAVMNQIRAALTGFDQAESDLLAGREKVSRRAHTQLLVGSTGALSLALLLGGFTTILSQRQARTLREANAQLTGTVSDRTRRLRDSEARFRQVFHDNPIGLTIATAETRRIVAANPAFCHMLGYAEAELLGRVGHDYAHPDDTGIVIGVTPHPHPSWRPIEKRYITKSGAVLFARSRVVPLALPGEGEPLVLGTTEDVTYEKAIEAALRDSAARLRLAVEPAGFGVWEKDLRRGVIWLDARSAALTGGMVPADVWIDLDGSDMARWRALIHPDDAAEHAATARGMLDGTSDVLTDEYRVRRADGSWAWIATFSTIAERDPDTGRPLRVLTAGQDVTRRKETELELRHAQRLEAVGQLTGGIAHDFNNLLGVILGCAELLIEQTEERPEDHDLATEILDSALHGASLTQRLLAFARRQPLQPAVINLNEYLPVHVSLLQHTLGGTVTVEVALAPGLWLTHSDPSQIVDVLLNLAINARDAMPHGGKLMIETANAVLDAAYCAHNSEVTPGEYVVLSVTDTGTGMTPDVLARAMEPFFTTKPTGKGTGLGLSTIYGFARQSGGHLSIDSKPGYGTTVRLYLPRTAAEKASPPARLPGPPPMPRGSETILVVDDNADMRTIAARNLTALGYRVRLAADGPEALAIMQAGERFDLLFTDVVMPHGLSGYQLAEAARGLQAGLLVLFTSGFAAVDDGELDLGNADALAKPYRRRELAERVRAVLDNR